MDLQADDTGASDLGILLGVLDGRMPIEKQFDFFSYGANPELVPIPFLDPLGKLFSGPFDQHFVSARFVVKPAPHWASPSGPHVALIAADFMVIGDTSGAELHSVVVPSPL